MGLRRGWIGPAIVATEHLVPGEPFSTLSYYFVGHFVEFRLYFDKVTDKGGRQSADNYFAGQTFAAGQPKAALLLKIPQDMP
jgi:hypothetical protein